MVSEPQPRPQPVCVSMTIHRLAYAFSSLCFPLKETLQFRFLIDCWLQGMKDRGSKREGDLLMQKQCTESHFYFLFIIYMHTLDNRWHCSFSPLISKQRKGMDDRAGSRDTKILTTRGKMPVYGIAFVSTLSSDIVPPGTARICAARTMI